MYQVIARKYRPQSFGDVVNQEHVKTTLRNAISQNRIAHGYIFSGQRGTGKTTLARILARCLNCDQGPTETPCGVCPSCLEIASGGAVDVIEIDAASNRGINEMRELRENVRYRPARDRFKVFIVDEAHQITNEAFNALLKTIEEPPAWVVFILCTTEAHKIPATIASRCQHFSFRSVEFDDLIARMRFICGEEGIEADAESLAVLAQAGEGSVRDSLSALDQAIACCGNKLDAERVRGLLGAFSLDALAQVSQSLIDSDNRKMLDVVNELERGGLNLQHFSRELSRYFRNLLVAKISGRETRLIAASPQERERMAEIAAAFSEEDLTRYLQLSLDLFRDLQFSLQPRFHLEIGLLKMIHAGRLVAIEDAIAGLETAPKPAPPIAKSTPKPTPKPIPPARTGHSGPSPFEMDQIKKGMKTDAPPEPPAAPPEPSEWREKLHAALMELSMPYTADAIEHSHVTASDTEIAVETPKEFSLSMNAEELQKAIRHLGGPPMRVTISFKDVSAPEKMAPAKKAGEDETTTRALGNPEVQRFRELFGGEVRTVRNLKE
ncbi:MAG: DNA polymerase III subunit gamma/tau [Acidobacteriota bacterium]|nr:DNA polymerase III subunit gamma/tau [Acidobacteriota bacterium]